MERLQLYGRYFRSFNAGVFMLFIVACLTLLGLVVLSSATQNFGSEMLFFRKQLIWLALAICAGTFMALVNLEWLRKFSWVAYGASAVLLLLVLIPGIGVEVNGARRWLDLGPMRMQVSDFAKIGMLFALAHFLDLNQRSITSFWKGYVLPGVIFGGFAIFVFLQPDFGTAALFGMVGFCLLFLVGTRLIYLVPTVLAGASAFSFMVYMNPERLSRVTSFLNAEAHKQDDAWQLWQGMLAFAAGGIRGQGLGNGRQQMSFLPEAHTDFIYPIIGEELGLFFTVGVALFFLLFFIVGIWHARKAPDTYHFTLMIGALLFVTLQALINMGVVTGCLPTKGMSLPFISYGGSNLVVMFLLVGIVINCMATWNFSVLHKPREL